MAVNERVQYVSGDVAYDQLAPSQANRTDYTPGVSPLDAAARKDAMNWPTDFDIPLPRATNVRMKNNRIVVVKLGRNIVSDQTIAPPIKGTPHTVTFTDTGVWGNIQPTVTFTPTVTQDVNGNQERLAGNNNIIPA